MLTSTSEKKESKKEDLLFANKPIILIGLMGAGKSSVGRLVAQKLNLKFFDADTEIEIAADCSIPEIFEKYGENSFRDCERRVINRLIKNKSCIIATGGGAFIDQETRDLIKRDGISIWLKANLETLVKRTSGRKNRPLLNTENPKEILSELMDLRYPIYQKANITVTTDTNKKNITCKKIISAIKQYYEQKSNIPIITEIKNE